MLLYTFCLLPSPLPSLPRPLSLLPLLPPPSPSSLSLLPLHLPSPSSLSHLSLLPPLPPPFQHLKMMTRSYDLSAYSEEDMNNWTKAISTARLGRSKQAKSLKQHCKF